MEGNGNELLEQGGGQGQVLKWMKMKMNCRASLSSVTVAPLKAQADFDDRLRLCVYLGLEYHIHIYEHAQY